MAGEVLVDGQKAVESRAAGFAAMRAMEVTAKLRYVGRGGLKLEAALEQFGIDVAGIVCADFGSSTGGFTDCLLQAGAARVHAIDVGTGQLDWTLRNDPRVVVHEGVNARYLEPAGSGRAGGSRGLRRELYFRHADASGDGESAQAGTGAIVVLVKPQFEVGKGQVGKGGIVRDPALHEEACAKVRACGGRIGIRNADAWKARSPARKATRSSCSMAAVKTVGIFSKPNSPPAVKLVPELLQWLKQRGIQVRLDGRSGALCRHADGP